MAAAGATSALSRRAAGPPRIDFYSAWFCPYAQRTWISLEILKLDYNLIESLEIDGDVYRKNARLLELNPKGLVPTLEIFPTSNAADAALERSDLSNAADADAMSPAKTSSEIVVESLDSVVYLDKLARNLSPPGAPGVPAGDGTRSFASPELLEAAVTLNKTVCSSFYRCLVRRDPAEQKQAWDDLRLGLQNFVEKCDGGPFYGGSPAPTLADVAVFPWVYRLYVLEQFRGMRLGESAQEIWAWKDRMEALSSVQRTLADKEKLLATYERYEKGTANSLVGVAVREGKEAHEI